MTELLQYVHYPFYCDTEMLLLVHFGNCHSYYPMDVTYHIMIVQFFHFSLFLLFPIFPNYSYHPDCQLYHSTLNL